MRKMELQILHALAESKKTFWQLLDQNHYLLKNFIETLESLYDKGLIAVDKEGIYLTQKGKEEIIPSHLEFKSMICGKCQGKRIIFDGKFNEILEEYKKIVQKRPSPTVSFFQGYMYEYDVVARVAVMHHYGDLLNNAFLLVGDDDLLSVALALTELPSRIVVLDIDERLGEFLNRVNKEYGFEIEFLKFDVSEPLPEEFMGKFDVFSSEPLETLSGLQAFLSRGVCCLKRNGVGYFGLTTIEASLKKWFSIEEMLVKMGCVITDVIRGFSVYPMDYGNISYETFAAKLKLPVGENKGVNWYKSALFRFEVMSTIEKRKKWNKKIKVEYMDPEEDVTYPTFEKSKL